MSNTVGAVMTSSPHTIGQAQPLSAASRAMREHGCRHLPVLHGGQLVGILSSRDVHLLESLDGVDPDVVTVEEAMTQEVYSCAPADPLGPVVSQMAERKYGATVVMEGKAVVGIFTTVDALRLLAARL